MESIVVNKPKSLTGYPSFFLDVVRIMATLIVYVVHCRFILLDNPSFLQLQGKLAHGAVIVFFVLSGYVIANSVSNKKSLYDYLLTRISKLTSIYLPAIIITSIIITIIYLTNQPTYLNYKSTLEPFRAVISLFYLQEIWFFSLASRFNGPLWSLGYEFWFYIIFGIFSFSTKNRKLILLLVCVFIGPKILIMMVIWIMGVLSYRFPRLNTKFSNHFLKIISISLIILSLALSCLLPSIPYELVKKPLHWASQFLTDWIVGLVIAFAFCLIPNGSVKQEVIAIKLRKVGNLTFPIYVLHFPLLILAKSVFGVSTNDPLYFWIVTLAIFILCTLFGNLCTQTSFFWKSKLNILGYYFTFHIKKIYP